jgi:hypothetical protein
VPMTRSSVGTHGLGGEEKTIGEENEHDTWDTC